MRRLLYYLVSSLLAITLGFIAHKLLENTGTPEAEARVIGYIIIGCITFVLTYFERD
jgi:hypothetical protein